MKKRRVYKYRLDEDKSFYLGAWLPDFKGHWGECSGGRLIIKKGYTWDGCSPTICVLGLFFLGSPDGVVDPATGKPLMYYPSLVHDFLNQFSIGKRKDRDRALYEMSGNFPLRRLYYLGVRAWAIARGIK